MKLQNPIILIAIVITIIIVIKDKINLQVKKINILKTAIQ